MKNENNNVAICDCLKAVVKDTVKHYARDYKIDEARIKQAAKEVAKTGKPQTFLWFARECGTYVLSEYPKLGSIQQVRYLADDDASLERAIDMLHTAREKRGAR